LFPHSHAKVWELMWEQLEMAKLTPLFIKSAKAGRYADGGGLYLLVKPTGAKSFVLRVQVDGKRRDFGLGSGTASLTDVRAKAKRYKDWALAGVDPVHEERKSRQLVPTFKEAAVECHEQMKVGWKNPKHQAQWLSTMESYVFPAFGSRLVSAIDSPMIVKALTPIWLTVPETARRVKQRIGVVLDYAHSMGWRETDAPMRAVGRALPRQTGTKGHFPAMPYTDVPAYMTALRDAETTVGRLALRFLILTAARSGEVRGATWKEVDTDKGLWTIPAVRMKARKVHVVPLSAPAIEILETARKLSDGKPGSIVFPGTRKGPVSDMTISAVMRDGKLPYVPHGFRASFRTWISEQTAFPHEVAEAALAHTIPNKVEAAYRRGDLLEKRRKLMDAWAAYCMGDAAKVVRMMKAG
jgi:integrase